MKNLIAVLQPLLRPVRVRLRRRQDRPSRSATATATPRSTSAARPIQKQPDWTTIDHNDDVRERARLLRHELEVRQHQATTTSTTTAPASSRTRSTPSRSSRPRPAKIHNNNIFWNNFNYYLPDSPVQTVSGGLGEVGGNDAELPDRDRRDPVRRRRLEGLRTTRSSATSSGARPRSRIRSTTARRRGQARTTSSRTTRTVAAAPTPTASTSGSTAPGSGNCFSGNTPARRSSPAAATPPHRGVPVPELPGAGQRRHGHGIPATRSSRPSSSTTPAPTPPQNMACNWDQAPAPGVQGLQADRRHPERPELP